MSSSPREARPRKTEFKDRLKRAENRATMTVTVWPAHQNHPLLLPLWRFEQGLASQRRTRLREFLLLRGIELGIAEEDGRNGALEIGRPTDCRFRKLYSGVSMVKPAKDRIGDNVSVPLDRAREARIRRGGAPCAPMVLRFSRCR